MRMPSHTLLCSFLFSTILTSALIASSGEVALVSAAAPASALAETVPDGPAKLTSELLSRMLRANTLRGNDTVNPAAFANTLGLGAAGKDWPDRQLNVNGTSEILHGFAVSLGTDPDILIYTSRPDSIHVFRSTRDGKAVTALVYDRKTNTITMRAAGDVQPELEDEFGFWARTVDKIRADGK